MITLAMGFDSITGAAIILLGGCVGFSTGTLMNSTTLVAQEIVELPPYSGIGYRALCFVIFLVITNIYLIRYATRIRKDPTLSPMYDLDMEELAAVFIGLAAVVGFLSGAPRLLCPLYLLMVAKKC